MTEARGLRRPRRAGTAAADIPTDLAAWFAGAGPVPWTALLEPDLQRVPALWCQYAAEHPAARRPDASWIAWGDT